MTEKERVLALFHHEKTDRVPTDEGLMVARSNTYQERPPFNKDGKDWFGVNWVFVPGINAQSPDPKNIPLFEDIEDWREKMVFPDLDAWDWSKVEENDQISTWDREHKAIDIMVHNGPFERMHSVMGFENALCALMTDPEEVTEYLNAYMEWKCKLLEKIKEYYHPDIVMFHDDYGTQRNMFFSPELWRELFKPQLKKAVDKCHELGMIFELHSCGFMEQIVPDFAEIGIDSWQGQEINDISKLKELTGDKLVYHTTPVYQDLQALDMEGSLAKEQVQERVAECFKNNAKGGNYIPMVLPGGEWWRKEMSQACTDMALQVNWN